MPTLHNPRRHHREHEPLSLAAIVDSVSTQPLPFRFSAYDGSATGPEDAAYGLHLRNARGASYLATAPGSLGLARAYVSGDLEISGVHPADPYPLLVDLLDARRWRRPDVRTLARIVRSLGPSQLFPPSPPPQETLPEWRRVMEGLRHSRNRDAQAIHHHYDVSNRFYELVLGDSMTYTCAFFDSPDGDLEQAQEDKYERVATKLGLRPGMRLLDVGCGWGGMVMHAASRHGVHALGVTLSREQAIWAQRTIRERGLDDLAEVRHLDYRDVPETDFDAISSIGLTEHIGLRNYPGYFAWLRDRLRPGSRLLNHCITRPNNWQPPQVRRGFINRYVFPDGEVTGVGRILTEMQNAGWEIRHEENLREHYALTLRRWCENLERNWDECVAEVGEGTAKVWGLYMAGSRLGFDQDWVELHQVLAVRPKEDGNACYPLRHDF
jgi:cyclopropane-fatty-acyl-phospholipid synthase